VSGITEDGCLVEWSSMKLAPLQGELRFKVQLTKVKDNETKTVSFELETGDNFSEPIVNIKSKRLFL